MNTKNQKFKDFQYLKIEKNQLLDILKPFTNIKYNENNNFSNASFLFLKSLNYPSIEKHQFKKISEMSNCQEILKKVSPIFKFNIELLKQYEKSKEGHNLLVTFSIVISWLCLNKFTFEVEILRLLYNIISQIPSSSNENKIFCLREVFSHYIRITNSAINLDLFVDIINHKSPTFLPLCVAEFLTTNDESIKQFSLSIISSIKNDDFFADNLSYLIPSIMPSIESLDKFGLDFFAILINVRDVTLMFDIIHHFPDIILKNIKKEIVFVDIPQFSYPIDGYLDYIFNFDTTDTLPDGMNPLNFNLFDHIQKVESFITEDLMELASVLSSFLTSMNADFACLFLNSIANFMTNWTSDAFYIVLILIFSMLDFEINKNMISAIMHPAVFSSGVTLFDKQIQIQNQIQGETEKEDEIQNKNQIQSENENENEKEDEIKNKIQDKNKYKNEGENEDENQGKVDGDVQNSNEKIEITYDMIFSLRMVINDFFLAKQKKMIPFYLDRLSDSPFIFAETLSYMQGKLSKEEIREVIGEDETTYASIMKNLSYLWYFCVHKSHVDGSANDAETRINLAKYRSARSTIFLFIFFILDDQTLCKNCFKSLSFVNGFLPRVLESSLQKLILNSLSKFLVVCNEKDIMMPVFQMISSLFKVIQAEKKSLAYELLNIINEASILNRSELLSDHIISSVVFFLNRFPSSPFLTLTLRLLTQISQNSDAFALNHLQIKQMSSAVRRIEDNEHYDETISAILGLIGLSHSVNTSSMFLIQKPSLITLAFSILRSKQKLEEILTFFSNLCKHSVFNIFQCHRGELDFLIIEMMKNVSKPFVFRGCQFDALSDMEMMRNIGLPLILNIVNIVCNNAVTTKLVRLISLKHELSVDILNGLNSSFSSIVKMTPRILPIKNSREPTITVKNIKGSIINQKFSLFISLFVDNSYSLFLNRQYYLCKLTDDSKLSISYILNGESIICRVTTESDIFTCTLLKNFPKCQWCSMILFFNRDSNNSAKFSLLTKDFYSNDFNIECRDLKNSKLSAKIGYTDSVNDDRSEFQGFPCFISKFALYPFELTKDMCFSALVTESFINDPPPIFSFPNQVSPNQLPIIENIKYKIKSILDVFTESQIFEFLPLFSPLDQMSDILLRVLLSLISSVLSYSVSLQSKFKFFPVISKLLIESNPKRLTYSLYLKFFSIIGNCTEPHIISEIIKYILLNFELWIRAEASQLIRIAQHWATSLYSACEQVLNSSITFDSLVSMVRMYFWFTPIETDVIRGVSERSPNLDINLCWQHIYRLLSTSIKSRGSSMEIVNTLLSHCASCKDTPQVIQYFSILRENRPEKCSELINEILFIFSNKITDVDVFVEALKTLYVLSNENTISVNIYSLLNVVQELKDNSFYDRANFDLKLLLDNFIKLLPDYPLIYPLVISISLYFDESVMINTSKHLGKIPKSSFKDIIKDEFWMVYILILAVQLPKQECLRIICFICSILVEEFSTELLTKVLLVIDLFDSTTSLPFNEIGDEILKAVTDLNLTNSNKIRNELFIIGAKTLLLHFEICSPSLQEAFNSSPFNLSDKKAIDEDYIIVDANNNDSFDIINEDAMAKSTRPERRSFDRKGDLKIDHPSASEEFPNMSPKSSKEKNLGFMKKSKNERRRRSGNQGSIRKVQSYDNLHELNDFKLEQIKSSKDLIKIFSIDTNKIQKYHFGIHLNRDEKYHLLLINVCQMLPNNTDENNESTNNHSMSFLSATVLQKVSQYLNEIERNWNKNYSNNYMTLFNDSNHPIEADFESLNKFFSSVSLSWSLKIENLVNKGRSFFNSLKTNTSFPVSKIAIAHKGINLYKNFLSSSIIYSNKMISELERRFGDIIQNKGKIYYKHRFCFSSNFTQPKVSQFAKNSIFQSKDIPYHIHSASFASSGLFSCECTIIKIINSRKTFFVLTKENIFLENFKIIPISSLSYILRRRVLQRKTALEFITNEGRDYLVDFAPYDSKTIIKKIVNNVKLPESCVVQKSSAKKFFTKLNNFTERWINRKITNFEYLMFINIFGGRSFRDPSNYPIFPWIISDFSDNPECKFDINNHLIYRNLFYPMNAQDNERRQKLLENFDINQPISEDNRLFFSTPSNPTIVSHWMIHEEPFTSLHLETEGGKFDISSRLFSSISSSAEQVKSNSCGWELTPEFYCKPEILLNLNNVGFKGTEENYNEESSSFDENERIRRIMDYKDNVILPNWAHGSPFEQVYLLRKALETDLVSQYLNEWIDMMFGVASCGEIAKEHFNAYSPIFLTSVWKVNNSDSLAPDRKKFIETYISKSGQLPEMLFTTEHPKRNLSRKKANHSNEGEEAIKNQIDIVCLFNSDEENDRSIRTTDERKLIQAATILLDKPGQVTILYVLGNGRVESCTVKINSFASVSHEETNNNNLRVSSSSSSATDINQSTDSYSNEVIVETQHSKSKNNKSCSNISNYNNLNVCEKREFVVFKNGNERLLNDIDNRCKYFCLEKGIIILNKDKLLFVNENSVISHSTSSISNSSISSLFDSDLLICDNSDSISIVNSEGAIFTSTLVSSTSSSSSWFSSSSFLTFLQAQSQSIEEFSSSSEILTLESTSTPLSKINFFSKSGKKQPEFEFDFKQIGRAHCEKPLVIASSKSFDLLAVTSIEGNVNLYSLLTGIYECTCYTSNEPAERIIITSGWGFVVVSTIQDFYLFNVNGFLIRKVPKTFNFVQWCCWTDERGFDYLGILKEDGSVVFCEAFYLKFSGPLQIVREPPVVMKYHPETKSLLFVTKTKKFISLPLLE